jgi:NAD+ diphosphatase
MVQDIYPSKLKNEYYNYEIRDNDLLLVFNSEGKILVSEKEGRAVFLTGRDCGAKDVVYLFSLDDTRFFLTLGDDAFEKNGFDSYSVREVREKFSHNALVAGFAEIGETLEETVAREVIVLQPNNLSLTNEMMKVFKEAGAYIAV